MPAICRSVLWYRLVEMNSELQVWHHAAVPHYLISSLVISRRRLQDQATSLIEFAEMIVSGEESTLQMLDQLFVQGMSADSSVRKANEVFATLQPVLDLGDELRSSAQQLVRMDQIIGVSLISVPSTDAPPPANQLTTSNP